MAAVADLADLAREWLALCEAAVATTVGGPIDCAFFSPGDPLISCPMLAVYTRTPSVADTSPVGPSLAPGKRPDVTGGVFLVGLTAIVTRCVPADENPALSALEAAAEAVNEDLWAIWNHTWAGKAAGTLFAGSARCRREMVFEGIAPLPIQGGCAGWQIGLRVQLNGFQP